MYVLYIQKIISLTLSVFLVNFYHANDVLMCLLCSADTCFTFYTSLLLITMSSLVLAIL